MKQRLALILSTLLTATLWAAPIEVSSPDLNITAAFEARDGTLYYSVQKDAQPIVEPSKIEIFAGAQMTVVDSEIQKNDTTWTPAFGQFNSIRDHHNQLTIDLLAGDTPVTLQCRVFDDGLGYRFVLSEASKDKQTGFYTVFNIVNGITYHWGERGNMATDLSEVKRISPPLLTEQADGQAIAFLDSDLYSANDFESMKLKLNKQGEITGISNAVISQGEGHVTPWRTLLFAESSGALMLNTVALNLAAPCEWEDTSWVRPGKGLWDWRIHGYDNGDFVYGIDTRSYLRLIDFCADQGLEYLTVDDHWFLKAENGTMEVSPDVDIEKVMSYAKKKGVAIMLYYDRIKGDFGDDTLFEHYADLGAAGMKYGFMGNKAGFTRNAIDQAAANKLMINFHDNPCPMAGVERTMPNFITREFCHGQQDSRRAFTPESFLRMAVVSSLTGPLDQSNGNFGIASINAGERMKGPKKKNSYISTVVSEVARCLIIPTGLVTLPDAPEEYLKKADLFEYLKQMPATWDESRVLHSKTGEYLSIARRSGDTWFVGSVNDETARTLEIKLDFLEPNSRYELSLFQDTADTHGVNNPEAYTVTKQQVRTSDVITAKMAVGGGHAMILQRKR